MSCHVILRCSELLLSQTVILDSVIAHNSVVLKLGFMSSHEPLKSVQSPHCYHHKIILKTQI